MVTTQEGPAVHVWDLRAIRRRLATMGLDWDAPAYSDDDPADPAVAPLPPLKLEFGLLADEFEHFNEPPATLIERYTVRLKNNPNDVEALHHRGHALSGLGRLQEAIDDVAVAVRLLPDDAHLRETLASYCNDRGAGVGYGAELGPRPGTGLSLALRAVALAPIEPRYLSTLGVAQYRAYLYAQATSTLERSLAVSRGENDAFNLFFLAMAHHRQGHREQARDSSDRALSWLESQKALSPQYSKELTAIRAEAESVLAGPTGELPVDVFTPLR